jgi:hypothetical protein
MNHRLDKKGEHGAEEHFSQGPAWKEMMNHRAEE